MKKIILVTSVLLMLAIVATGAWLAIAINNAYKSGPLTQDSIILIERGKGVSAIAQVLQDANVITSSLIFKIMTRLDKDQRPLKAGEYEFPANITMADALLMMREGKVYDRKITIPEGRTSWQVVEMLKALPDMSGDITEIPAEGSLLPDTYHYIKDEDRTALLGKMKTAMDKVLADAWAARVEGLPVKTPEEALILASIVEKETGVPDERRKVAGVFINRLNRGMPLQTDPTVIYGITKGEVQDEGQGPLGRRLLSKDLTVQTPYNTYMNPGLTPTPIANPGKASIEAALNPEVHDYIYFVADGTGGHVFGRTLDEHNRNVANWRKIRRAQ